MQLQLTHLRYLQAILGLDSSAARSIREQAQWQPEMLFQLVQTARCWESFAGVDPDWDQLPKELLGRLNKRLSYNRRQREVMEKAREEIRRHLSHAPFQVIWLKGDVLGKLYWKQPEHRHQFDLDLLVAEDNLQQAVVWLNEIGFRLKSSSWIGKRLLTRDHAISLIREGMELDLHWCIRNRPVYQFNHLRMWERAQRVELSTGNVLTLFVSDLLAAQLISVFHDLGRGGCSLKGLLDLWLMLEAEREKIDWLQFRDERLEENTWGPCVNVLSMLLSLFNFTTESPMLQCCLGLDVPLIARGSHRPLKLLSLPRRSSEAHQWMMEILPVASAEDALWLFTRSLPNLGRTLSVFQSVKSQCRTASERSISVVKLDSLSRKKVAEHPR